MRTWDGKTRGTSLGYKFFILIINILGVRIAYLFSYFVSIYFVLFSPKERNALIHFYKTGFTFSTFKSFINAFRTFKTFGQILIDRLSFNSNRKSIFSYSFKNDKALEDIVKNGKGGLLISAHLGNWEIAGSLVQERVIGIINIVLLDNEVDSIKKVLTEKVEKPKFNIITIKEDFSHLFFIKQALERNEFVAMHADRFLGKSKNIKFKFLGADALFPLSPFLFAEKLKVPVSFVYAVKKANSLYQFSASDPIYNIKSAEALAKEYVLLLEKMTKNYKNQWFNFHQFHVN